MLLSSRQAPARRKQFVQALRRVPYRRVPYCGITIQIVQRECSINDGQRQGEYITATM